MAGSRIKGITIEIGGDTTKLQTALKNVNSEIRSTESKLKDVNKLLKMDPGNTELLSQKYKTLQQEIGATKEKLGTLKEAAKQAEQALKDGTVSQDQYDALQREIAETEQNLKSLEQEYKNFGSVQAQEVAAAGEKMKDFGDKVANVGAGLTTGVTLPLVGLGTAGAASFAEVDKTMQLTNQTMGNTAEEAEMLNQAMKDAAAKSTYGMKDAATATLNFARAGLDAAEAASALAPAMNLAAGEGGDLDTVSAGLVATINGFHGEFRDAGHYADVFAAACNNSALDVNSLSDAMSVAAPIFASAGYSVNDAALYMGVMANNGIDADKAATALKTGLARLVSPAKDGAAAMDDLGICVTNADGSMKDSVTIQKELHEAFSRLSESEQLAAASAIFGKNHMSSWLALINSAPEDVMELDEALVGCAGTTDKMAQAMMSGFGGSLEKLKSSIDVLVTSIGEALAPTILSITDFIQKLVDKFNALTPAQQQTIVKIGLIVAAVGPLLIVIGKVLSAVGSIMTFVPKIASAIKTVIGIGGKLLGGLKALWGLMAANPITLVIAAIAAAVAAFIYFWNTSEGFRQFWINLWQTIKAAVETVVQAIITFFTQTVPQAFQSFAAFFQGLWQGISEFFSGLWEGMKQIVTSAWEAIQLGIQTAVTAIATFFTTVLTVITTPFQMIWDTCKQIITTVWEEINTTVSTALTAIQTGISTAWAAVQTVTTAAFTAIQTAASSIWMGIQTAISTIASAIQSAVSTAWETIRSVTSTVFNTISNTASTVWQGIQNVVSTVTSAVQSVVSSAWEAVSNTTETVFSAISTTASTAWENTKTAITTAIEAIRTGISSGLEAIKTIASTILTNVETVFTSAFDRVWSYVSGVVERLKGIFNFSWSLPHISMPHFSISGSFSLNPPSVPSFSVEWYRKAMNNGMILNSPTIFGMAGNRLLGGGEAGPEAVVGVSSLMEMIQSAVGNVQSGDTGNITIPVYIGGNLIDEVIVTAQQRRALRSGGRA